MRYEHGSSQTVVWRATTRPLRHVGLFSGVYRILFCSSLSIVDAKNMFTGVNGAGVNDGGALFVNGRLCVFGSVTALRSGEDNSNQWMGVTVVSQRSPLGHALVSDTSISCV